MTGYHPDVEVPRKHGIEIDEGHRSRHNPKTLESNVKGIYLAGAILSGENTNEIFIENGRFHGASDFQTVWTVDKGLRQKNARDQTTRNEPSSSAFAGTRAGKPKEESLEELAELTTSAGAEVADALIQERAKPGSGLSGRARETGGNPGVAASEQANLVIFNEDLSPAQLRNLETVPRYESH